MDSALADTYNYLMIEYICYRQSMKRWNSIECLDIVHNSGHVQI